MLDIDVIKKLKKRYVDKIYALTREEQEKDLKYIADTFIPATVRYPHKVLRLGLGSDIVNSPAEQIVTSNPQAFIEVIKGSKDSAIRISKTINDWIDILRRQNPNPFKESVKNKLSRGENYIKLSHNEAWVTNPVGFNKKSEPVFDKRGLPVLFLIPDPMVVYGSPEEDENGIPEKVVISYERQPEEVIAGYPDWVQVKQEKKTVQWFEYWDNETKHFAADDVPVLMGDIQPNIYGFTPIVRKYSGFGRRSPDGELANLIVSDIRNSRGLIEEICIMRSDIASVLHLSAHKPKTLLATGKINEEQIRQNLTFETYTLNILDMLPEGFQIRDEEIDQPTAEAYAHTANIMADLTQRHPYIMAGFPWGASGRQQGMVGVAAMRRYDTVVENTELEWATAFEMAFKIMKAIPTLLPEGLRKSDLDVIFKCSVKLKAKDPIEEDRLATLGSRLLQNSEIDPITNLVQFKGYTQDEARQILVNILKWKVLLGSPDIAELIGLRAAEKSGMAEDLGMIKARRQELERKPMVETPPPTSRERVAGETETEIGREMGVVPGVGARKPPVSYERRR